MKLKQIILFTFALIINSTNSFANFMVTPGSQSLESSGKTGSQRFVVQNLSKKEVVVDVSVIERSQVEDKEMLLTLKDYKSLFRIYPKILKVKPNQKKAIVVKWVGEKEIKEEKVFYLRVAEKLLKNKDKSKQIGAAKLNILMEYYLNIFVTPKNKEKKASLVSSEYLEKENRFKLKIKNEGTVHFVSNDQISLIKKEKDSVESEKSKFSREELKGFAGNLILPGKEKTLYLKAPKGFEGKNVSVKLLD